jgi:imidazolonepropionase-like amidohydrolase
MTPMEAITAATKVSAEAIGREKDLGTIEPSKLADIILVEGDPLKDIRLLQDASNV